MLAGYSPNMAPLCSLSDSVQSGEGKLKDGIECCYGFLLHNTHTVAYRNKVA